MGELGKQPITLVEIDLPYCSLTYGVSPCTAVLGTTGSVKCFNCRSTCQDVTNYDETTKTVIYATNQDGIPDEAGVFPALKSVSTRPAEINLSGFDPKSTALGTRARVSFTLQDFADADTWLDKYQSERVSGAALASAVGYSPIARGSHLSRLTSRFPYYNGIPVRVRRGYVGDARVDMPTEYYVMSGIDGPNAAGVVSCTAKDVLDLVDNKKATYPAASTGKLLSAITETDTSATLTPSGIGSEYASSGLIRIGSEIMTYTLSGDDLTLTRAQEGTTASTHAALDLVQECAVLDGVRISDAIETILSDNDAFIASYIDSTAWQEEYDTWLGGFKIGRVIISEATGKTQLIGELCQLGVMVWADPESQSIILKANAPIGPDESYVDLNDDENNVRGSIDIAKSEDQRASSIWLFHGVKSWTATMSDAQNYDKLSISAPAENLYGTEAIKKIYSRWFGRAGNDATASVISERLLSRYEQTPTLVSGYLDVKDRDAIKLGTRVMLETYLLQDVDGAVLAQPMQINYAEYSEGRVKYKAESFRLEGAFAFWMDSATAPTDWDSATEAQRSIGAFWDDATNLGQMDNGYTYF